MRLILDDYFVHRLGTRLVESKRIVIICHVNPDGDALGSGLGLWHLFRRMGFDAHFVVPNGFANSLAWMPGAKSIINFDRQGDWAREIIATADLRFFVDFNTNQRMGKELAEYIEKLPKATTVLVDHHPMPDQYDFVISDTSVSSTCELLHSLMNRMEWLLWLDKDGATCLYLGIMTDTGGFRHNCGNPITFFTVAELITKEVDVLEVQDRVNNRQKEQQLRLLGYCLSEKMVIVPELGYGYIVIDSEEKKRFQYEKGDVEGFVNMPLAVKGIFFAALFMAGDGDIKCSFRSSNEWDVNRFAREGFNGGGHSMAAGGRFTDKTLEQAVEFFVQQVENHRDELRQLALKLQAED